MYNKITLYDKTSDIILGGERTYYLSRSKSKQDIISPYCFLFFTSNNDLCISQSPHGLVAYAIKSTKLTNIISFVSPLVKNLYLLRANFYTNYGKLPWMEC